jgi:WhiB family redox-sensing transcriptional regulator
MSFGMSATPPPTPIPPPPMWQELAACIGHDPELWYSEVGTKTGPRTVGDLERQRNVLTAKMICRGCEVRQECLDYCIGEHLHYGIWGGQTEQDRKRRRAASRTSPIEHGTARGYNAHKSRHEEACGPCKIAHAERQRRFRLDRKARMAANG